MRASDFDLVRHYRVEIASFVVTYAALELLWLHYRRRTQPDPREVSANLFIYVIDTLIRLGTWSVRVALFTWVYSITPLRIPTTVLSAVICYVGVDFILYWFHRLLHENELGWALHSVHHTSRAYNVSLGVRISWPLRAFDDVVYLPLPALGFEPLLVLAMIVLNRFSQYWIHTEMIGRLPLLDGWLNTPSNHRVHHAASPGGERANYGSNFIVWDRLFGTYRVENGANVYGSDEPDVGSNPFVIQFSALLTYARRLRRK